MPLRTIDADAEDGKMCSSINGHDKLTDQMQCSYLIHWDEYEYILLSHRSRLSMSFVLFWGINIIIIPSPWNEDLGLLMFDDRADISAIMGFGR
jgi:hypothetical protein